MSKYGKPDYEKLHDWEFYGSYLMTEYQQCMEEGLDIAAYKELFEAVVDSVSSAEIDYIFSLVNSNDIYNLFSSLDFKEVNKEDIFIEEQNYQNSKFKDTKLMIKKIS